MNVNLCRKGLRILRQLLSNEGVDPNVMDRDGRQPVHWAGAAGAGDALLALVHHGAADIHAPDGRNGLTALHCAAAAGHADCLVQLITLCGARVDAPDANGCTPLFYAAAQGHQDCVDGLLSLGAEANTVDRKGRTAAHGAAARGHLAVLSELQRHDGNLWATNAKGNMPLHDAVSAGHRDVVRWLLARRPSAITAENSAGRQPLHVAAAHGTVADKSAMVRLLVDEFFAPVNAICRDSRNRRQLYTPLDLAQRNNTREIVRYLRQAGGLSAKQLVNGTTLRQAFANAIDQLRQLQEDQQLQQSVEQRSGGDQPGNLALDQSKLTTTSHKNSAVPLMYSPEVVVSPISPFSWRSCYTVNTEQAAAEVSSSRSFFINRTSAIDGDSIIGGGGDDEISHRQERWQSISSANFTNNDDERVTNKSSSSNSSNESLFMLDNANAFMAIPRTLSAPDLTVSAAVPYRRMPERLTVGGLGNSSLGGSLRAGLDRVAFYNIDTPTEDHRHTARGPDNENTNINDQGQDDYDINDHANDHFGGGKRGNERQITFALASPHHDSNNKGQAALPSPTSSSSPRHHRLEQEMPTTNGRCRSQDDLQTGKQQQQQFVYEATFRIVTQPQQQRRRRRRPKTTLASSIGGESDGDVWRWQRRRRRQLHEQLLRQQLAAVAEEHRRMLLMTRQEPSQRYEATAVKRLVAAFNAGLMRQQLIGLRGYHGPYTFESFEAYLEDALDEIAG
jgi:ankyrin repeat protein